MIKNNPTFMCDSCEKPFYPGEIVINWHGGLDFNIAEAYTEAKRHFLYELSL